MQFTLWLEKVNQIVYINYCSGKCWIKKLSESKKTRSEMKREAIIEAAKKAFQSGGVQNTSMDSIAEIAQVSKRTVYNHFKTKEELVMHIISELWNQVMVQNEFVYQKDTSLEQQLSQLVKTQIDLVSCEGYINLTRVAFSHFLYHPEELKKEVDKFIVQETVIHRWLVAATEDGRLKPHDIETGVKQLHNLIKGICYWPQFLGIEPICDEKQKQVLTQQTVTMFLSCYKI